MNQETNETQLKGGSIRNATRQILFLAALISTLFGFLYLVGLTGKLLVDGSIHSVSSPPIQMVSAAIGLLWDITLLIMFVALRRQISRTNSIFAELGLIFMALVCATSSINWFVQLTLVPRIAQTGNTTIVALVDIFTAIALSCMPSNIWRGACSTGSRRYSWPWPLAVAK